MVNFRIKLFTALFTVALFGCSTANNKPVLIGFSADNTGIIISGINPAGLLQLKNSPVGDSTLYRLISVLKIPSDQDTTIKESALTGKFSVTDSNIIFTPDQPFIKGNNYLVITYINAQFGGAEKMLKGTLSSNLRPIQKTLAR